MKRLYYGNEAHRAAGITDLIRSTAMQMHEPVVCKNPNCVKHHKRFRRFRVITTVVMITATITGMASFVTGEYVITIMSLVLGNASHVIDVWFMDRAKDAYMRFVNWGRA